MQRLRDGRNSVLVSGVLGNVASDPFVIAEGLDIEPKGEDGLAVGFAPVELSIVEPVADTEMDGLVVLMEEPATGEPVLKGGVARDVKPRRGQPKALG